MRYLGLETKYPDKINIFSANSYQDTLSIIFFPCLKTHMFRPITIVNTLLPQVAKIATCDVLFNITQFEAVYL